MDFRLLLSGDFGEFRDNHLHSGIDIKTQGTTGASVYAVADGYVSRINVSAFGYGKALYITHPSGYVSVYGHLDYFTGDIHKYVIEQHYKRESFEMTLYPKPGELPVRKGDIVAYSGNSGSAAGPHLHFEIRDEATQRPINPLLFGFEVKDYYRPRITGLKIYAIDSESRVNGMDGDATFQVEGWGTEHRLKVANPLKLAGNIAFGIQCYDQQNDTKNKNGVFSVKVYFDGRLISSTKMESFDFSESRYVNSLIDYSEYMHDKVRFQRTEIDPGNKLDIYEDPVGDGIVFINDELMHKVKFEITDVPGNMALLEFNVQGEKVQSGNDTTKDQDSTGLQEFYYDRDNRYENDKFKLEAPAGAFYRSFEFKYHDTPAVEGCYSAIHHIHDKYTPIQDNVFIAIKPEGMPAKYLDKALIVKLDDGNRDFSSAGGNYQEDGFIHTDIREFGDYSVAVDTIAPTITPLGSSSYQNLAGYTHIRFKIKDELSGIKSYRGSLNGHWILMEYDAKNDLLVYYIDSHMNKGTNTFRLEVRDMKNNLQVYETTMVR